MLGLRTCPSISLPFSPSKQSKKFSTSFKPYNQSPPSRSQSSIKISATSTPHSQGVEHIVLFKVKQNTEPKKVNDMIKELESLVSLEMVRYLTFGSTLNNSKFTTTNATNIPFSDLSFTHLFHSRYDSIEELQAYNDHPKHLSGVRGFVFPICEDLMVGDWIAGDVALPPHPSPGTAFRVRFVKPKDEKPTNEVKEEVFRALGSIKESVKGVNYVSYGENISPARTKGFSIVSLAVFSGRDELDRADPSEGLVEVKDHLESVLVVDYVVPSKVE